MEYITRNREYETEKTKKRRRNREEGIKKYNREGQQRRRYR